MNETERNTRDKLTLKQQNAITHLLSTKTVEEAAKKAGIAKTTLYAWMKQDHFKQEVGKRRRALYEEGLSILKASTRKAAEALAELLEKSSASLKRLVARDVISLAMKAIEQGELEERISRIEEALERESIKR